MKLAQTEGLFSVFCKMGIIFGVIVFNAEAQDLKSEEKESFIIEQQKNTGDLAVKDTGSLIEGYVELYEEYSRLCTKIARELTLLQDKQLNKIHEVLVSGESFSEKKLKGMVQKLKTQIDELKLCILHISKG